MSLLDELSGVQVAIVDDDERLIYAWFGGMGVNIYDEDGREVHYFTIGSSSKPTPAQVRSAIARFIAETRDS